MKVAIVPIGNSRGVRLPKQVLRACGFADAAELTVEDGRIVLAPVAARQGWAERFASARDEEGDAWLDAPLSVDDEWSWPEGSTSGSSRSTR